MDVHEIHGEKIGFHSDARDTRDFLKHGMHSDGFKGYLKTAEKEGKAHFIDKDGTKFTIEHHGEEGFSVRKSNSQH